MQERLQKLLAAAGAGSRRACEELIRAGRVTVNGRVVEELGARADPAHDDVRLDGRRLSFPREHSYFLLHKPRGYTSTVSDPHARHTVMELLPADAPRVFPAGRLDRDSEGLLLLTDDGELTARLLHPSARVAKEYAVLVRGRLSEEVIRRLQRGVRVDGEWLRADEVEPGEPPRYSGEPGAPDMIWLRFVLHEGRKRQIRAMCAGVGLEVTRLARVRLGPLALGNMKPGSVRRLTDAEIARLRRAAGLTPSVPERGPAARERGGRTEHDRPGRATTLGSARGGRAADAGRGAAGREATPGRRAGTSARATKDTGHGPRGGARAPAGNADTGAHGRSPRRPPRGSADSRRPATRDEGWPPSAGAARSPARRPRPDGRGSSTPHVPSTTRTPAASSRRRSQDGRPRSDEFAVRAGPRRAAPTGGRRSPQQGTPPAPPGRDARTHERALSRPPRERAARHVGDPTPDPAQSRRTRTAPAARPARRGAHALSAEYPQPPARSRRASGTGRAGSGPLPPPRLTKRQRR